MKKILVTGAVGQIGSELTASLREKYGHDNVIASDVREPIGLDNFKPFEKLDVLSEDEVMRIAKKHEVNTIFHLAAILSANGEKNPHLCWDVNMNGLINILETARKLELKRVICVSSIAVFGPGTPRDMTPQKTVMLPTTMYGVTKVAGELLCEYYVNKYGLDIRGLRYPGLISYKTLPGGGTTDYAVEIYYEAIKNKRYTCFLKEDTMLPMMYMPDAIRGTIELAETDFHNLTHRTNFNFSSMSVTCGDIAAEIKKHIPEFTIEYKPDFRQEIADTWPASIDDSTARQEWDWKPEYGVSEMTEDMLSKLREKLEA